MANRVVVPYVSDKLHSATREWSETAGAELHELSLEIDDYWKSLVRWWSQPGDLFIVEQDVIPSEGVVSQMLECEQLWCSSPYGVMGLPPMSVAWVTFNGVTSIPRRNKPPWIRSQTPWMVSWITDGLGCVKFSDQLKRVLPNAMEEAGEPWPGERWSHGDWHVTDRRLSRILRRSGFVPHLHPRSLHAHRYRQFGSDI